MGTPVNFDKSTIESLVKRVHGEILLPDDDGYGEARTVWNAKIDKHPAVIVQCSGAADVMASVDFAREQDIDLAIKGGGHHAAGHAICDDGAVIDLSPMDAVQVDPTTETVRVQGGATWGDIQHELDAFGLEIVGAVNVDDVGVAGYTLGGGMGYNMRKRGLAIDNLRSVDVVTAEGRLVHASEATNEDLFWALRGGSGNFGVVTSFEFDCHESDRRALVGQFLYPMEDLKDVLRFYREYMNDASEELVAAAGVLPLEGDPVAFLGVNYMGDVDEGQQVLQPVREFGEPIDQEVAVLSYSEMGEEPIEDGQRSLMKSVLFTDLSDEAISTVSEWAVPPTGPAFLPFFSLGGAVNRVPEHATAYPHRDAEHTLIITPQWNDSDDDEEVISWAQEFHEALAPYATGGEYLNNQSNDDAARVEAAYGDNYNRLVEIKTEWDPENLFHLNQNIEPNPN